MNRIALIVLSAIACQSNKPAESYGYLARLGNDTVSIERVTRRGDEIVSDEVDRFPRVRRRHTTMRSGSLTERSRISRWTSSRRASRRMSASAMWLRM